MEPVLECKNICFSYHSLNGETRALSDISFQVEKGEFLAIVGPSGCGNAMVLFWILWKPPLLKNTRKLFVMEKTGKNIPVLIWRQVIFSALNCCIVQIFHFMSWADTFQREAWQIPRWYRPQISDIGRFYGYLQNH